MVLGSKPDLHLQTQESRLGVTSRGGMSETPLQLAKTKHRNRPWVKGRKVLMAVPFLCLEVYEFRELDCSTDETGVFSHRRDQPDGCKSVRPLRRRLMLQPKELRMTLGVDDQTETGR